MDETIYNSAFVDNFFIKSSKNWLWNYF